MKDEPEHGLAEDGASDDPAENGDPAEAGKSGDLAKEGTSGDSAEASEEPEWWDDPRMPWKGKPGRADLVCWIGISLVGIYSLVMMPLRAYLVVANPVLQAGLTGSRSALVVLGVTDHPQWWLGLILGIVSIVKFDWIYFLAGRLWGRGLIELFAGRSPRAARNADRAERLARRWGIPAVLITYLPIPIPAPVIYATVAMAGMSWRTFWIVDIIGAVIIQCTWVALGFWLGEPARVVVEAYAQISMYVAFAILIAVFVGIFVKRSRTPAETA